MTCALKNWRISASVHQELTPVVAALPRSLRRNDVILVPFQFPEVFQGDGLSVVVGKDDVYRAGKSLCGRKVFRNSPWPRSVPWNRNPRQAAVGEIIARVEILRRTIVRGRPGIDPDGIGQDWHA